MTNLFIIGNGFDLAHGMKTKYSDFRDFLINTYLNGKYDANSFYPVPEKILMPDGDEVYKDEDVVKCILKLIDCTEGYEWNDIEASLGYLQYHDFLDDYDLWDSDDDNYMRDTFYKNQDLSSELHGAVKQINTYFHEWLTTIDIATKTQSDFMKLINPINDLFLNFNYTSTLQTLYNAQNVCHIHGQTNQTIYFGHGEQECPRDEFEKAWFGAESSLERLHFDLMKNTKEAYENHKDFFLKLNLEANNSNFKIYSYGFSFSNVDTYYLKKICKIIDTEHVYFYMNDYDDSNKRNQFAKTLISCGFKGKISSFHIEK